MGNGIFVESLAERICGATQAGRPLAEEKFVESLEQQLEQDLRRRKPRPRPGAADEQKRSSAIA
jgi:hypothetical protein